MAPTSRSNRKVLVLPGDGIGPEIMREVMRVIEYFDRRDIARFDVSEGKVGGAAYDASGTPLTDETLGEAMSAEAAVSALGGPNGQSPGIGREVGRGGAAGGGRLPRCRAVIHVCGQLRDAASAAAEAVRCDRHPQSVRRPAVGLRGAAGRLLGH